eukprot:TRINITY_DN24791_c0_g1_i1.p1 TRINITY_DN24791_c0_g1~~TRINITY_DN24791_c0_g1_i1.p1  ORF type:complete len:550 (+),score=79.45 TRINITY_DN24791_c0_g1_i1:182-1831(+)
MSRPHTGDLQTSPPFERRFVQTVPARSVPDEFGRGCVERRQQKILESLESFSFPEGKKLPVAARRTRDALLFERMKKTTPVVPPLKPLRADEDLHQLTEKAKQAEDLLASARNELDGLENQLQTQCGPFESTEIDDEITRGMETLRRRAEQTPRPSNVSVQDAPAPVMPAIGQEEKEDSDSDSSEEVYQAHKECEPVPGMVPDRASISQEVTIKDLDVRLTHESRDPFLNYLATLSERPQTARRVAPSLNAEEQIFLLQLGQLRALGPPPSHWPKQLAILYARLNVALASSDWQEFLSGAAEGLRWTYGSRPAILAVLMHEEMLCVLLTTFEPDVVCAGIWGVLFRILDDTIALCHSEEQRQLCICKQRTLLDDDFVAEVLDNLPEVGLKRRVQALIGCIAGLTVQRQRLPPPEYQTRLTAALSKAELPSSITAASPRNPAKKPAWRWTPTEVASYLQEVGCVVTAERVLHHGIDGATLINLSEADLVRLQPTEPSTPRCVAELTDDFIGLQLPPVSRYFFISSVTEDDDIGALLSSLRTPRRTFTFES